MKITVTTKEEKEVKYMQVYATVRHCEDAEVDGVEDTDGELMPCLFNEVWSPLIELDTGIIQNWTKGVKADVHYKVCDAGVYELQDEYHKVVKELDGYVPAILSPNEEGYGDYIILTVNENGQIENWKVDLAEFSEE